MLLVAMVGAILISGNVRTSIELPQQPSNGRQAGMVPQRATKEPT
jgi:uncharacterized membrane protein YecN with MAPEG domain